MQTFEPEKVFCPESRNRLVDLLAENPDDTLILGGGTFIQSLASKGFLGQINRLIDLSGMNWSGITNENEHFRVGSTATFRDIFDHPVTREPWAGALHDSIDYPPPQITNMATVGGSLASSTPLFDVPIAFMALNGTVRARGPDGERDVPLSEFFDDLYEHTLDSDEVIAELSLPRPDLPSASALEKCETNANDLAIVNVAGSISLAPDENTCEDARIILGGGGVTSPQPATEAEQELIGEPLTDSVIDRASQAVEESIDQRGDLRGSSSYREYISGVLTDQVLNRIRNRLNGVN